MLLHHRARKLLQLLIYSFIISYVHGDVVFFSFCSMIAIKYFHSHSFVTVISSASLPDEITYNLRDVDDECYDEGSQFWGSFWLFDDEGQTYFELHNDHIYAHNTFPDRFWLGIGWNENCQLCVVQHNDTADDAHSYKRVCKRECLDGHSFIVIGQHDLSLSDGWGFLDVDVALNASSGNYSLFNRKNAPISYNETNLDFRNVFFFQPHDFDTFTTDNVWAEFQRTYDAAAADDWSRLYDIELTDPSMPTFITYISSRGLDEHSSVSAQYTQTPEIVEFWDVACVNVTGLCFIGILLLEIT